jgi:hypothetical protein
MVQNRAIEMLTEAYGLIPYYGNRDTVQMLVRLAIGEVQELLDRLARYESPAYGVIVEGTPPMRPARLTETKQPFAALPVGKKQDI